MPRLNPLNHYLSLTHSKLSLLRNSSRLLFQSVFLIWIADKLSFYELDLARFISFWTLCLTLTDIVWEEGYMGAISTFFKCK